MPLLRAIGGPYTGRVYDLKPDGAVLGRNPDCSTIVLESGAVSRLHAKIDFDGLYWHVEDAESHNGTMVNGEMVPRGADGRRRLRSQDVLEICGFRFVFEDEASQESSVLLTLDPEGRGPHITSEIGVASSGSDIYLEANPAAKLKLVLGIIEDSAGVSQLKELLSKVLDRLFFIFRQAERGFIMLREDSSGEFIPHVAKRRDGADEQIRFSRTIVDKVIRERAAVLSTDADKDQRLPVSESVMSLQLRSIMCMPLIGSDEQPLGVIELDVLHRSRKFTAEDLELLAGVARHVAIVIENARLHEKALRQQKHQHELDRLHRELELAREIQQTFLPSSPPPLGPLEFFQFYQPAEQVGGDYFDYIPLPGDRLAIVVADVVGDGVPASLLMCRFAAETRYCLVSEPTPARAIERLNDSFARSMQGSKFITLLLAVFHLREQRVTFINAGHWPPLLARGGSVESLQGEQRCFPIGLFEESQFPTVEVGLKPGDGLAMFTDGMVDASNQQEERYGLERLSRQFSSFDDGVAMAGKRLLEDLNKFVGGHRQVDDMCLLLVGCGRS